MPTDPWVLGMGHCHIAQVEQDGCLRDHYMGGVRADGRTAGRLPAGVLDVVARLAGGHQAYRVVSRGRHARQHVGAVSLLTGDVVQLQGTARIGEVAAGREWS